LTVRTTRKIRAWDRSIVQFVEVVIDPDPDLSMSCSECRFYDGTSRQCCGIGSTYYRKRIPFVNFVPRKDECEVRLPPDLGSYFEPF
jgi:hypothetical protein